MAGIYIHIPYCKKRCIYCDFHFIISQKNKPLLLKSIQKELVNRSNYLKNKLIQSIYFGGGTPSLLTKKELISLLKIIYTNFTISKNVEITLEANPEDLNKINLALLKKTGINRLSIGVQSFFDSDLKFMNRSHNAKQAENAIINAKKIGFTNISIDLIFGLPNQSTINWEKNYKKAFSLGIQHLSAYCLTIEKNTPLEQRIQNNYPINLSETATINSFKSLMINCEKYGFKQYEISNYAKKGYESIHNISYWKKIWYLGVGPSAHSFNGISRQWNIKNNLKYISAIENSNDYSKKELLSEKEKYNEYIFTNLRMSLGINKKELYNFNYSTRKHLHREIQKWIKKKLILDSKKSYTLTLAGKLQADNISSDLFLI